MPKTKILLRLCESCCKNWEHEWTDSYDSYISLASCSICHIRDSALIDKEENLIDLIGRIMEKVSKIEKAYKWMQNSHRHTV